jgi:hypothetical protein
MGTNRAVFFLEPRPHLQDTKFTFIRGLRRLEGIQEFFLIVNRPKWIPGFAVEVTLETAHYFAFQDYLPRLIPYANLFTPENLEKTAAALGLDLSDPRFSSYAEVLNTWNTSEPFARFIARQYQDQNVTLDQITALVNEGRLDWARISDLVRVTELLPDSGPGDIALIFEKYESDSGPFAGEFFVAGRRLGSAVIPVAKDGGSSDCESSQPANISIYPEGASIVHESSHEGLSATLTLSKSDGTASLPLNSLTQRIRDMHHSSLGDPARYPYATVTFFQTEFVLDQMAQLIRLLGKSGIKDMPLGDVEGLQAFVGQGLGKTSNVKTLVDLGTLTTTQVRKDLNLPVAQAKAARRTILILALKNLDPSTLPDNYALVNPIQERLYAAFSPDRLEELLNSGHPPANNHGTPAQDGDRERDRPA